MDVAVLNRQRARRVNLSVLVDFMNRLTVILAGGTSAGQVGVCLISDRVMRDYNRRYRMRRGTTDVLAFEGESKPTREGGHYLGDIAISVPQAVRQAREAGHSLARELQLLLLHGYLHLLGYDHEKDEGAMRRLERRLERRLLGGSGGSRS